MTRSLIFSMVEIRLDIAFSISILSRFAKNLSYQHTNIIKTILQYLKGFRNRDITYERQNKLFFERYSNFNWAGDKKSQKSTSSYIFILNGGPMN